MKCSSLSLRAFNTGGFFELRLPNGKTILIDPCFSHLDPDTREWTTQYETGHTREDIEAADYILLTHTHWDHDLDIGYFVEKYGSLVFCSHACAEELLKYHKIPYDKIVCCYPGSRYTLDDFTLEVLQSKHNPQGTRTFQEPCLLGEKAGAFGHSRLDQLGNMYSLDWFLTTNNHFSVLMAGGMVLWNDIFDFCREKRPNLLLRQSGMRRSGAQVPPDELAALLLRYHAQIVIPYHQEGMVKARGLDRTREYFREVDACLRREDPGMALMYPETGQWYDIGIDISVVPR